MVGAFVPTPPSLSPDTMQECPFILPFLLPFVHFAFVFMQARNLSSAMSAASSACDHIYNWVNGTPKDTWVSMGVYSDGSYGAPKAITQ